MNKKYWDKFYRKFDCEKPSSFAKFCLPKIPKRSDILDIGCGNMRDTFFFAGKKMKAVGVDMIDSYDDDSFTKHARYVDFYHFDVIDFIKSISPDYFKKPMVYARFFLHAIERKKMVEFIAYCSAQDLPIYAECRSDRDEQIKKDKSHRRNLVNSHALKKLLWDNGYKIEHFEERKGLAKWKGEDPVIIRFIAKK